MPHPTSQVSTPVHKKTSKGQMSIKHTERDTQENLINMPMLENRTKTPRDTRTPMKASFRVLACVWVKGRPELCRAKQPQSRCAGSHHVSSAVSAAGCSDELSAAKLFPGHNPPLAGESCSLSATRKEHFQSSAVPGFSL